MIYIDPVAALMDRAFLDQLSPTSRAKELHRRKMARISDKESNMKDRLARRRHAIWWKWTVRGLWGCFFIIAIPLFLALANFCWQLILS